MTFMPNLRAFSHSLSGYYFLEITSLWESGWLGHRSKEFREGSFNRYGREVYGIRQICRNKEQKIWSSWNRPQMGRSQS
jgi:hypothetical protein